METLIHARRDLPFSDAVEIHLAERKEFGLYVAQPPVFTEMAEGAMVLPFLSLRMRDAQRLMDELWGCGLRPSEGTGSAGSLRATEKHLTDMQRIAFMLLERPNVEVQGQDEAQLRTVPLERRVGGESQSPQHGEKG